ncbi:hypothetical protein EYZ11_007637 [Aspergillus tanneri]|uniref:histidine kinase n=1 Tax=Aspergillus tanneri TaxID=1220188 RepID=A0A4S3JCW1_9EURO|nr:uncharacterized protein ATNIH1004_011470 [Aspergillus tanneri]KAA8642525.1 hypothetical protein ATNIH1004_011470 [Aspergillus tanneri]THC92885.1 hypothetical protein EYZ11_007637 [Aspergillus tanneri]
MVLLGSTALHDSTARSNAEKVALELSRLYSTTRGEIDRLQGRVTSSDTPSDTPNAHFSDTVLPTIAQLGLFHAGCAAAFVTLIHNEKTNIIARATASRSSSGQYKIENGDMGVGTLGLEVDGHRGRGTSDISSNGSSRIIHDLAAENNLKKHSFVVRFPETRLYAEMPLYSSRWGTFGTYCVVDDKPRAVFNGSNVTNLRVVADAVVHHLENIYDLHCQRKLNSLLSTLMTVKGLPNVEGRERIAPKKQRPAAENTLRQSPEFYRSDPPLNASNKSRDTSPISARLQARDEAQSSPFFPIIEPPTPPSREKHQTHLRKCSDDSSHLVTVPEKVTPSPLTSLLFSRASSLLQECMGLDGVLFLDAAQSNPRSLSHTTASASDWDALSKDSDVSTMAHSPGAFSPGVSSQGACPEKLCEPLAMSIAESAHESGRIFRLALNEGLLRDMLVSFPQGEIFYPEHPGGCPPNGSTKHWSSANGQQRALYFATNSRLAQAFPGANSLVFCPIWNWDKSCWLTAIVAWTGNNQQLFGQEDLYYLKVFGDVVASEYFQIGWTATEKSKSDLLSSVSHELRSPLHGMLASTELLQTTPLERPQKDIVKMIETCGMTLLDTMNHLLDFTKINNLTNISHLNKTKDSQQEVELDHLVSRFEMDVLVEDVAEALYSSHRTRTNASKIASRYVSSTVAGNEPAGLGTEGSDGSDDLMVVVRIEEQPSWTINSISGGWRRVVMNLLGNAFKFTRSGLIEVSLSQRVERSAGSKTVYAHISITDTGCGISRDFLEQKLFKPFTQEDVLTEGVGLGLSVVREIVTYLGGTVDLKSEVGKGTQVDVFIPVEFLPDPSTPRAMIPGRDVPGARTVKRVSLIGMDAYASLYGAPAKQLSTNAKRKLAIRCALSNVLLSQPGWTVSFAESLDKSSGDIGVIEESTLKKIAGTGSIETKFKTILVLGEQGVSLPGNFAIKGADVIYLSQPLGPRKITEALQRSAHSHCEALPYAESPISGPFSGIPNRGRSLSEAFALAKGTESPPVAKENVSEYSPPSPQIPPRKDMRVLIVDDNDINLKILSTFMRKIGCTYETASNGLAALEQYKSSGGRFEYVLMDISMPIMDGIVSSRKIREYEELHSIPRAAIMAVTGVASSSMQQQAFAAGIDDYLIKPLSLHDLKRIMNIP